MTLCFWIRRSIVDVLIGCRIVMCFPIHDMIDKLTVLVHVVMTLLFSTLSVTGTRTTCVLAPSGPVSQNEMVSEEVGAVAVVVVAGVRTSGGVVTMVDGTREETVTGIGTPPITAEGLDRVRGDLKRRRRGVTIEGEGVLPLPQRGVVTPLQEVEVDPPVTAVDHRLVRLPLKIGGARKKVLHSCYSLDTFNIWISLVYI